MTSTSQRIALAELAVLRLEIASKILAGFAANNAVFAHNPNCGWSLVNCSDEDVVRYSLALADKLIGAENFTASHQTEAILKTTGKWREGE